MRDPDHAPETGAGKGWRAFVPIAVILALGLAVGVWLANDYGMSWDEDRNADVGADALALLSGSREYFSNPSLADHGPVYFMVFSAGSRAVSRLLPGWTEADGRHFVNFTAFLIGVVCFYLLSRRVVKPLYAGVATAIFATQPLLFGYAFVSQKDIPFLSGFMATLVLGLKALDGWRLSDSPPTPSGEDASGRFRNSLRSDWQAVSTSRKVLIAVLGFSTIALSLDLGFGGRVHDIGESLLEAAYQGNAPVPVQQVFERFAVDAYKTPFEAYAAKYDAFFRNGSLGAVLVLGLGLLVLLSLFLPTLRAGWGFSRRLAGALPWLASAAVLGFTISIRPVGGFVGLLVSGVALRRGRGRALFPLVIYWLVASLATLATWPYLWPDPIGGLAESLRLAAVFSLHRTLFRGQMVATGQLPWDFFPTLTALQLTETAVLLVAVGLILTSVRAVRRERLNAFVGILALWVGVPLVLLIGFKTAGYEFRHFLFMLPPLLMFGGMGLEAIGDRIARPWAKGVLFAVALLPGLVALVQLHPYEHIYFNNLAGGVSGADGLYQLDRECLSYREAIEFVDRVAGPGAVVVVPQQTNQVEPFAREDLVLHDMTGGLDDADFVLSCTWRDQADWPTREFRLVHEIRRGTAVLTQVWQRASAQ